MNKILLLEDDLSLVNGLTFAFHKQGFDLTVARTLREADAAWARGKYDLLVLDVSLPDGSGFTFCQKVRLTSKVPIIFLTATDEETSGLDIGGDDYITKPFKLGVLFSRINALLRRAKAFGGSETELSSNGLQVRLLQGQAFTWKSSNKLVTVKDGNVTADPKAVGKTVTITATAADGTNKSASIKLKIVAPAVPQA